MIRKCFHEKITLINVTAHNRWRETNTGKQNNGERAETAANHPFRVKYRF